MRQQQLITVCVFLVMIPLAYALTNRVSITDDGRYRYISSNGIPEHSTGQFPNRGNPNRISEQRYHYRVLFNPTRSSRPTPLGMNVFGVAINGVPLDPGAAEFWNNDWESSWQYEAMSGRIPLGLDHNNAHVQPNGAYHYHGLPPFTVSNAKGRVRVSQMRLFGYAADGFPIYALYAYGEAKDLRSPLKAMKSSWQLKKGTRPSGPGGRYDGSFVADYSYVKGSGDLDECNGRFGVTPEYPSGTYYYVLTRDFPFIPRFLRGTPDSSFLIKGGPDGRGGPGGGRRGAGGHPPPHHRRGEHPPPHHKPGDGPHPPRL